MFLGIVCSRGFLRTLLALVFCGVRKSCAVCVCVCVSCCYAVSIKQSNIPIAHIDWSQFSFAEESIRFSEFGSSLNGAKRAAGVEELVRSSLNPDYPNAPQILPWEESRVIYPKRNPSSAFFFFFYFGRANPLRPILGISPSLPIFPESPQRRFLRSDPRKILISLKSPQPFWTIYGTCKSLLKGVRRPFVSLLWLRPDLFGINRMCSRHNEFSVEIVANSSSRV